MVAAGVCRAGQVAMGGDEGLLKGFSVDGPAGVGVAVEAGEVAAGYLQSDPVTGQEHVGGRRQVQGDLVDVTGLEERGIGAGVAIARTQAADSEVNGAAAWAGGDRIAWRVRVDGRQANISQQG